MSAHTYVLVGYDGTKGSELALQWAAREAMRRRRPLTICHAWRWPYPITHIDYEGVAIVKRMGEHLLQQGAFLVADYAPRLAVRQKLMDGPAASALLHLAGDAEVIVVGSHEAHDLPIGSSVIQLTARAHRPVVVVRDPGTETDGRIVVGVDGTAGADRALEFAMEAAAVHEWRVVAVYGAWEPSAADADLARFADRDELAKERGCVLQKAVAPWQEKFPYLDVRTKLVLEEPRKALLDAAQGANLLVVGDRGAHGLPGQLLGATTRAMLEMAPGPVAVVRS